MKKKKKKGEEGHLGESAVENRSSSLDAGLRRGVGSADRSVRGSVGRNKHSVQGWGGRGRG